MSDVVMTREQAAEHLGVTKRWLELNWRDGPRFYRLNKRVIRYKVADLDRWMEQKMVRT